MSKLERLVNLIALLTETRRPLTVEDIRGKIPDYAEQKQDSFRRMFERDKRELRELGIPIELQATDVWEAEEGYLISKEAMLQDPGLTDSERAALSLAAQAWRGGPGGDPAMGLLKIGADPGAQGWMHASVDAGDPNVTALMDAVSRRKRVTFDYARPGAEVSRRTIDPYTVVHRSDWYVYGFDHDRTEIRMFKVPRISGQVSVAKGDAPDFPRPPEAPQMFAPWEGEGQGSALVAFEPEAAWWAERKTGAARREDRPDGWVVLEVPVREERMFVDWVLGFGDRAELLEPADLREQIVRRIERAAGRD